VWTHVGSWAHGGKTGVPVAARRTLVRGIHERDPAGPVGGRRLELVEVTLLTFGSGNGFWWSGSQSVRRVVRGLRQEAYGAISPGSRIAENAGAGRLPNRWGSSEGRPRWLQRVSVASTALPPKVGDAGNGYSTSSRTVRSCCSRSGAGRRNGQGAAGQAVQIAGLGVGTPVGTRDNRSRLQRLVRGILFECSSGDYANGGFGIAVDGDPLPWQGGSLSGSEGGVRGAKRSSER